MRTRNNDWLDGTAQQFVATGDKFTEDGKPYFASSEEERELKRKELRKLRS